MKRELDTRINAHGDRISLVWYPGADRVELEVEHGEHGSVHRMRISAERARDAFDHPYLYLPAEPPALAAAA